MNEVTDGSICEHVMQGEGDDEILRRVTPMPNSKGQLVVEVDKVNRDLIALSRALKMSKFSRLLLEN
jgi:hypothetical protein